MKSAFYLTPIPFTKNINKIIKSYSNIYKLFQILIKDSLIIDLGCGIEEESRDWSRLCLNAGAKEYIGVDENNHITQCYDNNNDNNIRIHKEDILQYLKSYNPNKNKQIFSFWGMELVNPKDSESLEYVNKILKLIYQKSHINDIIIIGNGTHGIDPTNCGFVKKRNLEFDKFNMKIYVKEI